MPADHDSQSSDRSGRRADPMAEHKRRARWRLLGAIITVAAVGAIAPFFLEEQARPLSQDLLIEIPSRSSLFTKIDKLKPAETATESSATTDAKREEPASKTATATASAAPPASSTAPATSSAPVSAAAPAAAPPVAATPTSASTSAPTVKSDPIAETKADASKKPGKGFLVQVGVYSKPETAKSVQAKLTLGGHKVWLEPLVREDGIERYRVRIGPFETREQANEVRDRAKSQGYEAIVVTNP